MSAVVLSSGRARRRFHRQFFRHAHTMYKLSFTSGSLMTRGMTLLAGLYAEERDWVRVRSRAELENALQTQRRSSSKRVIRELVLRLSTLEDDEVAMLNNGQLPERTFLSFVAICRYYEFVREFVLGVVRPNWLALKPMVDDVDYSRFYDDEELKHEELAAVSDSTRGKLREVLFRILSEAGLLDNPRNRNITPPVVPRQVASLIGRNHPEDLPLLLMPEHEIQRYTGA